MAEEDYNSWLTIVLKDLVFCLKTERSKYTQSKITDIIDQELAALEQAVLTINQIDKP